AASTSGAERANYEIPAAQAYGEAFRPLDDPAVGQAVAADVIDRLAGLGPPDNWAVTTTILLDDFSQGKYIRLGTEAVAAPARLLPDPLRLGLTDLDATFLQAIVDAWQFIKVHLPGRIASGMRWGWSELRDAAQLRRGSAGTAWAVAMRAA